MGLSRELVVGLALAVFVGNVVETKGAPSNGLVEPHIIGGVDTAIEEIPYQISLEVFRIYTCSGAIVGGKHALTGGICVYNKWWQRWGMRIRAGSSIQIPLLNFFGGVTHQIQSIEIHPEFAWSVFDYDVAIITVSKNFEFGSRVQPIAIPIEGEGFLDYSQTATVSGWGLTKATGVFNAWHLQSVDIPLVPRQQCMHSPTPRMLCGAGNGKGDTCTGDGGGPLVQRNKLIGLVSWGYKQCNVADYPSVFTNLLDIEIRSFIKSYTGV